MHLFTENSTEIVLVEGWLLKAIKERETVRKGWGMKHLQELDWKSVTKGGEVINPNLKFLVQIVVGM